MGMAGEGPMEEVGKKTTSSKILRFVGRMVFYALMALGVFLMVEASAAYIEMGTAHPFFLEKLPLRFEDAFKVALYTHIPASLFALPACLILLLKTTQKRLPRFHRWLGRITGMVILGAVVPSGFWLAFSAKGGLISTLGFLLTGAITGVAMLKSIATARAGQFKAHRRFSTHVAAQLSVAITSRLLLVAGSFFAFDDELTYIAALWGPIIFSVWLAERLTTGRRKGPVSPPMGEHHEKSPASHLLDVPGQHGVRVGA
jgi:uncharacterized membrane protein